MRLGLAGSGAVGQAVVDARARGKTIAISFQPTSSRIPRPLWPFVVVLVWGGLVLALALLSGADEIQLCWFARVFDVPCLACGGTRATLAAFSGEWLRAVQLNPLVVFVELYACVWIILHVVFKRRIDPGLNRRQRRWLIVSLAVLCAANWGYLILRHLSSNPYF